MPPGRASVKDVTYILLGAASGQANARIDGITRTLPPTVSIELPGNCLFFGAVTGGTVAEMEQPKDT